MPILLGLNKVDIKDCQKSISVDSRYSSPHAHPTRGIFRWHDPRSPQPLYVLRETVGLLSLCAKAMKAGFQAGTVSTFPTVWP